MMTDETLQYRPEVKKPIGDFFVGKVVDNRTTKRPLSPSLHVLDRKVIIENISPKGWLSGESKASIELDYASSSYIHFEIGKCYLFAIAGHYCLGFLEVLGNHVIMPDNSVSAVDDYIVAHRGYPFPDYYGYEQD